jgi:tetratricopeptide (TPR) repeat protein
MNPDNEFKSNRAICIWSVLEDKNIFKKCADGDESSILKMLNAIIDVSHTQKCMSLARQARLFFKDKKDKHSRAIYGYIILYLHGLKEEAIDIFSSILEKEKYPLAYAGLASAYFSQDSIPESIKNATTAIELGCPLGYYHLGALYSNLIDEEDTSKKFLETSASMGVLDAHMWLHYNNEKQYDDDERNYDANDESRMTHLMTMVDKGSKFAMQVINDMEGFEKFKCVCH